MAAAHIMGEFSKRLAGADGSGRPASARAAMTSGASGAATPA